MRPLKLKMRAFGAYVKPLELDFEKNLRGSKVFLIHGATGAGKTTILDAISFALYGSASGNDRNGLMMRSRGVGDNVATEVEFKFALGEKIYTVWRNLIVKADKITQNAELKLFNEIIATKKINVTNKIEELLGFKAGEFRQVVMLPQGEFKRFLTAKSNDRQPILDALFNAEFYNRVEEAIKVKCDTAQKIFDDLSREKDLLTTKLNGAQTDAATLERIHADLDSAQKQSEIFRAEFDKTRVELAAGEKLSADFEELMRRNNLMCAAESAYLKSQGELKAAKIEYDLREGEKSIREDLKTELDRLSEIKESLAEVEVIQKKSSEAQNKEKSAKEAVKKFEAKGNYYEELLAKRKKRLEELTGADKMLAEAKIILDSLTEITRLEGDLSRVRQRISIAEKNYTATKVKFERLQGLQRSGRAALLAKTLKDGEPCPVCGSRTHYAVDFGAEIIPSDEDIKAAQIQSDNFKERLDEARQKLATIEGQLLTQRKNLQRYGEFTLSEAQKNYERAQKAAAELEDYKARIKCGEKMIAENKSKLKVAEDEQRSASDESARLFGELQSVKKRVTQNYSEDSRRLDADIKTKQKTLQNLEDAWKIADKNYRKAENKNASNEATFKSARESRDELSVKLNGKEPPELEELKRQYEEAHRVHVAAIEKVAALKKDLDEFQKLFAQTAEIDKKLSAANKNLSVWRRLSDTASGKVPGKKISFTRYYLRAMFEQVLTEANYCLGKMSDKRYWFRQKDGGKVKQSTAGLNLEIFDEYIGEARPVETLSGGESFLASLSLALGLAAVVRNNSGGLRLDTIFIDEGFGTLDSETLDFAIKTLIELQSGGRLIGIISHVEELKNQVPVRLEVFKGKTGSYAKFSS